MTAKNKKPLTIVRVTLDRVVKSGRAYGLYEVQFNQAVSELEPFDIEYFYGDDELDAWNKAKKEWGAE